MALFKLANYYNWFECGLIACVALILLDGSISLANDCDLTNVPSNFSFAAWSINQPIERLNLYSTQKHFYMQQHTEKLEDLPESIKTCFSKMKEIKLESVILPTNSEFNEDYVFGLLVVTNKSKENGKVPVKAEVSHSL